MLSPAFRAQYPSLTVRSGLVYYRWRRRGRDRYERLPAPDSPDFDAAYRAAVAGKVRRSLTTSAQGATAVRRWNARQVENERSDRVVPSWLLVIARGARKRAALRQLDYSLSRSDLSLLARRAGDACEITGIPFAFEKQDGSLYRPFAPSLDRIDSAGGYTLSNIRIVCVIVNAALNQWGEGPFWQMVAAAAQNMPGAKENVPEGKHSRWVKMP